MRSDPGLELPPALRFGGGGTLPGRHFSDGASQSGKERNHLFLSLAARQFADVSGVSGLDHPADGRALAVLDYDRDGWSDLAVVNANAPLLQLFRNEIGAEPIAEGRGFVAVRLVGANHAAEPAPGRSNRDGVGARVEVELGDVALARERRAGEGFAAQNSATLGVGIGERDGADAVAVHWPSGAVTRTGPVPSGSLVTVYEDPSQAPTQQGFALRAYRPEAAPAAPAAPHDGRRLLARLGGEDGAELRVLTTLATWCEACREDLPQLELLGEAFGEGEVGLYGLPIDPTDTQAKLDAWLAEHRPPYEVIRDLAPAEVAEVDAAVREAFHRDAIPVSFVVDAQGRVQRAVFGAPTVSDLRALLADGR